MSKKLLSAFFIFTATILISKFSFASDAAFAESSKCSRYFALYENQFNMPNNLIKAVAVTESGRYVKGAGRPLSWPWTVNVNGKSYYYNNKREAVRAVNDFQAQGFRSIDVGCMQINLKHHPAAFRNLEQAFEPKYNIAYAAQFLKEKYKQARSWKEAIGLYHNGITELNRDYINQVYTAWRLEDSKPSQQVAFLEKSFAPDTTEPAFGENVDRNEIKKNVLSTFER